MAVHDDCRPLEADQPAPERQRQAGPGVLPQPGLCRVNQVPDFTSRCLQADGSGVRLPALWQDRGAGPRTAESIEEIVVEVLQLPALPMAGRVAVSRRYQTAAAEGHPEQVYHPRRN